MNQTTDHDGQQSVAHRWLASKAPIEHVPLVSLQRGDSPRITGQSKPLQLCDEADIPPIIVHRPTMGVIDGARRVRAARCQNQDTIAVRYFDGTVEAAFVLSVVANLTTHGLPLSPKDRKADAARILGMYPGWSDHAIAANTGLSPPTVAAIRGCSTKNSFQSNTRRGRDGKNRPVDANAGRRAAAALMLADDSRSLREVARRAGVSLGTAHDVRCRLRRGVDPSVSKTRRGPSVDYHVARGQAVLTKLESDPSVSLHDDGKAVLRLLHACLRLVQQATPMITKLPEHCLTTVADCAAALSDAWGQLARDVRAHAKRLYAQRN